MTKPEQGEGDRSRDELLAGEYVLGVLSHADRIRVEARVQDDRHFAAIVARWQENLSDFNDDYVDEAPPLRTYARIEQKLFPQQAARTMRFETAGWWNSLHLWRGLTFASLALLVTYAALSSGWIGGAPPARMLTAQMSGSDGAAMGLLARYDTASGRMQLVPVAAPADDARSLQLWLVPDGGAAPLSLGILPQVGEGGIDIPVDMRPHLKGGVTFAVSLEPAGGSPTGQPTGPVIAAGKAQGI